MENNSLNSILRKKNKPQRKDIPGDFLNDSNSIPETIKVYYKQKINFQQINKVIKVKLEKLKDFELLEKYNKEISDINIKYETIKEQSEFSEIFLDIASKYIKIERIKKIDKIFLCKGCNNRLENFSEEKEGFLICKNCNCINSYLIPNHYTKDLEKTSNYFDDDSSNFLKILDKFEGKTSLILKKDFLEKLDNYFLNRNFIKGEEVRKLSLDEYGKKEGTTKKMLWGALECLGYPQYYDEINYITNVYWGWKLPELYNYKEKIIKDYKNTQNAWNIIKSEYKRSASLGTQYRIYVHLLAAGYPNCFREDFKLQENVESLRLHNSAWKRMCEMSNLEYKGVSI